MASKKAIHGQMAAYGDFAYMANHFFSGAFGHVWRLGLIGNGINEIQPV
jgi:hypothetical protein